MRASWTPTSRRTCLAFTAALFVHDGWSVHRAHEVKEWARGTEARPGGITAAFAPVQRYRGSVDLDQTRRQQTAPFNHNELRAACQRAWKAIGQAKINAYVAHAHATTGRRRVGVYIQ